MNLPNLFFNYFIPIFVYMIYIEDNKKSIAHFEQFKVKQLSFEFIVDTIIEMKDGQYDNIEYCYMGANFIVKDSVNGDYYIADWSTSGDSGYSEFYTFYKIYSDLFIAYIKGDISYHAHSFESFKRSGVLYRMSLYNSQFVSGDRWNKDNPPKIEFKVGNTIEYSHGYVIPFEKMNARYMTVPYQYKDMYKGFPHESESWDDNNFFKQGAVRRYENKYENKYEKLGKFIRDIKLRNLLT